MTAETACANQPETVWPKLSARNKAVELPRDSLTPFSSGEGSDRRVCKQDALGLRIGPGDKLLSLVAGAAVQWFVWQ